MAFTGTVSRIFAAGASLALVCKSDNGEPEQHFSLSKDLDMVTADAIIRLSNKGKPVEIEADSTGMITTIKFNPAKYEAA